ncbi:hypothetical protein MMC26_002064 [Xylographa opegraphella]|nr:hypothetical protein [Xylographa opegraphella]
MADEPDSRTVAFDRKRPPDDLEDPDSMVVSKKSRGSPGPSTGQAPTMTWNTGAKTRIRTTLGGPRLGQRTSSVTTNNRIVSLPQQLQAPPSASRSSPSIDEAKDSVVLNLAREQSLENNAPEPQHETLKLESVDGPEDVKETEKDSDIVDSLDEGEVESEEPRQEMLDTDTPVTVNQSIANQRSEDRTGDFRIDSATQPMKLADLPAADLAEQLRYFHVARDPSTVLLSEPVRCLICAKEGHTISSCPALICKTCHKYKDHFTHSCPQTRRCQKCREAGHHQQQCPYKLPRLILSEIQCDLCQLFGHVESDCELRWRSSGLSSLFNAALHTVALHCFECGQAGHLGNDCPTRNPRKQMGSSTWSIHGGLPSSGRIAGSYSQSGIVIKGRAQQAPATLDSDEESTFLRPRVAPPARGRGGKIRVSNRQSDRWSGANDRARGPDEGRRPQQYAAEPMHYDRGRQSHARQRDYDTYRPPLPNEQPPPRKGERIGARDTDIYRPMPSAAQNAWKKRRT